MIRVREKVTCVSKFHLLTNKDNYMHTFDIRNYIGIDLGMRGQDVHYI